MLYVEKKLINLPVCKAFGNEFRLIYSLIAESAAFQVYPHYWMKSNWKPSEPYTLNSGPWTLNPEPWTLQLRTIPRRFGPSHLLWEHITWHLRNGWFWQDPEMMVDLRWWCREGLWAIFWSTIKCALFSSLQTYIHTLGVKTGISSMNPIIHWLTCHLIALWLPWDWGPIWGHQILKAGFTGPRLDLLI